MLKVFIALLFSLLLCSCSSLQEDVTATISRGGKYCAIATTPESWNDGWQVPGFPAIYRLPSNPSELLFTLEIHDLSGGQGRWPADTKYLLDLDRRGTIRKATDAEWSAAHDISRSAEVWTPERETDRFRGPNPGRDYKLDTRVVTVNGHQLGKSGGIWWGIEFAPTKTYVALVSFDGCRASDRPSSYGVFYLEIYDAVSARLLAKIHGNSQPYEIDPVLLGIQWVSGRDLVMAIDNDKRKVLVCRFDN
jgi:hypothetical protein